MKKKKLNIGVIGCGKISRLHLENYRSNDNVNLKVVCDIDSVKAKQMAKEFQTAWYTTTEEMLDQEFLEGVSVCVPPAEHLRVTSQLMQKGINVLCEKPIASTVAEAKKMIEIAEDNGVILVIGVCHRFHEPVQQAKKLIQSGVLGKISMYRNRFGWVKLENLKLIRSRGGIMLDNGFHSVDLFRWLVGPICRVSSWVDEAAKDIREVRDCVVLLKSENGAIGVIELNSSCLNSMNIIEIYGSKGRVVIDYLGNSYYIVKDSQSQINLGNAPMTQRFHNEIGHFINVILGNEKSIIGAEEGLKDLEVLEAAYRADKERKWIKVS